MTAISNGGAAQRVKVLTDADLRANGGPYSLEGRPPVAVYGVTDAETTAQGGDYVVMGNVAQPVYVVDPPDGVGEATIAPIPMIAVDSGLALGFAAIPVYVVGGSLGGLPPDPVTNLTAIPTGTDNLEVLLDWGASTGATGYIVEYSDDGGMSWVEIADTPGTDYAHTAPTYGIVTHAYRIRAYNGSGESANETVTIADLLLGLTHAWMLNSDAWTDEVGGDTLVEGQTVANIVEGVGRVDGGVQFTVIDSARLEGDSSADYSPASGAKTIVIWVNPDDLSANQCPIAKDDGGTDREWFTFIEPSGNLQFFCWNSAGGIHNANAGVAVITAAAWNMIALRFDGTTGFAYSTNNGANTASGTVTTAYRANTPTPLTIGNFFNVGFGIKGVEDIGLVYARVLSSTNEATLWNGGNGIEYPFA